MKNVQVIDGADNCIFPVYELEDEGFSTIFPAPGQTIEFAQDLAKRLGSNRAAGSLIARVTAKHADKATIAGIHGTLFIDMPSRRKFFPTKRESDAYTP